MILSHLRSDDWTGVTLANAKDCRRTMVLCTIPRFLLAFRNLSGSLQRP
jgi:hypothetical protein